MKTLQFLLEDFNPDGMTISELCEWANFIGNGNRPQVAKQWFPGRKGQFRLTKDIRNYCWNKVTAMGLRMRGEIQTALTYERICDEIYAGLPEDIRW